jgi:hypothetical protein
MVEGSLHYTTYPKNKGEEERKLTLSLLKSPESREHASQKHIMGILTFTKGQ